MHETKIDINEVWGWLDDWESERSRLLQDYAEKYEDKAFLFDLGANTFKNFICRKLEEIDCVQD